MCQGVHDSNKKYWGLVSVCEDELQVTRRGSKATTRLLSDENTKFGEQGL